MVERVMNDIAEIAERMVTLRRKIHQHPEPAYEEVETARTIVDYLKEIENITLIEGVGKTGVVATLGGSKSGPCIALRADMDCLRMQEENTFTHVSAKKGLMHGCGHDGHIACLVGAALALGRVQEQLPGPVKFIFQPAEENYAGAQRMIADGVLDAPTPQAIFGLHGTPSLALGRVGLRQGAMMAASRYFIIRVNGSGTHAAMPHKGVDCVLVASYIVCAAHSIVSRNINPLDSALISIPIFNGSSAPNVLPSEVVLQGTLRALSHENVTFLERRLQEVVSHTAESFGATATIEFDRGYPLLENDTRCADYLSRIFSTTLGEANVENRYPPSLGAEDFAFYLEKVPGAFYWLGLGEESRAVPLHNPRFDFNDKAIATGIMLHCQTILNAHTL